MKTTPEERALLRAHAVKGSKAPRTTATFTADAILRLLDDVDELLNQRVDGKTLWDWMKQKPAKEYDD